LGGLNCGKKFKAANTLMGGGRGGNSETPQSREKLAKEPYGLLTMVLGTGACFRFSILLRTGPPETTQD